MGVLNAAELIESPSPSAYSFPELNPGNVGASVGMESFKDGVPRRTGYGAEGAWRSGGGRVDGIVEGIGTGRAMSALEVVSRAGVIRGEGAGDESGEMVSFGLDEVGVGASDKAGEGRIGFKARAGSDCGYCHPPCPVDSTFIPATVVIGSVGERG